MFNMQLFQLLRPRANPSRYLHYQRYISLNAPERTFLAGIDRHKWRNDCDLGLIIEQNSGGVKMINSMRLKYGTEPRPWSGSRVFTHIQWYQFGRTYRILEDMVARRRVITAQVGPAFVVPCKQTSNIVGFTLKSPELEDMMQLAKENFASIKQEISEEYASNPRIQKQMGNRPKPERIAPWVTKEIAMPRAIVSSRIADEDLDAVLEDLKDQSDRFWSVNFTGFQLYFPEQRWLKDQESRTEIKRQRANLDFHFPIKS